MTTDRVSATGRRLSGIPLAYLAMLALICWVAACSVSMVPAPSRDLNRIPPLSAEGQSVRSRLALVVGNANYGHGRLRNSVNDAQDIAAKLRRRDFEVMSGFNLTRRQMLDRLLDFRTRLAETGGVGLFYFAGHGAQFHGKNYLLPLNAEIDQAYHLQTEAVAADRILADMHAAGNEMNIFILDACRNNPFPNALSRGIKRGLTGMDPSGAVGTYIAYATAHGREASDGAGRNSPFAQGLLAALDRPGLEIDSLFRAVRRQVMDATRDAQVPWSVSSLTGNFYFLPIVEAEPGRPVELSPALDAPATAVSDERAVGEVFRDALSSGGKGPEMVVLPTGGFRMGSTAGETGRDSDEGPVRMVNISKRIAMGRYEVTFADYDRFVAATRGRRPNDRGWGRGRRPVIDVSQEDAKAYATWLSAQTGKTYRLPSEAEWEYAARAGTRTRYTRYSWGDEIGVNRANCNGCGSERDSRQTVPVGSFEPNAFGLYDMHGNVWEWVADCWHGNYEGAPTDGSAWTTNCDGSRRAVVRGSSWDDVPRYLRSAFRNRDTPSSRFVSGGFRLVQDLNPLELSLALDAPATAVSDERAVAEVFRDALRDGGEGPAMVVLLTGSFRMGSGDEGPVRTVNISRRIAMGRYEVTFADYDRFVSATSRARPDDEGWGRGRRPVIDVSQEDAQAYATWLSAQTGKTYRLPSEAEWEYAARAGTETAYSWGDEINCRQARYGRRSGGECSDSYDGTVSVGSFEPNAFGLFDMHGNVWE